MINKKTTRVLSGIIISAYMFIYAIPAGFCITNNTATPVLKESLSVAKPVLRTSKSPSALKLEGDISLTKGNPKINLSLRDSDVRQVLRMFADKAGLNIIFHDSATGKVTLDLVNVPLNDAFRMVLQITNLTYYIDKNTMVVVSANASQALNLSSQEMMTIPVKYADAAALADFLNRNIFSTNKPGLSNALIAVTNPSTNEILIFGTKNDYLMAQKIVAQFDVKPRNEIFTVNHTTPKEMAELVCRLLFREVRSSSSVNATWTAGSTTSTPAANNAQGSTPSTSGAATGGGAENGGGNNAGGGGGGASASASAGGSLSSSGSSTASSGTTSSGANSVSSMTLGGGVTACNYQSSVIAGKLSSVNMSGLSVTYFPQRGSVEVFGGSEQQMEMIKDFIAKNDIKQPQAYLEVSIIELNETGSREFSNSWNVLSDFFSGSFDGTTSTSALHPTFFQGDGVNVYKNDDDGKPEFLYAMSKYTGTPIVTYSLNYVLSNGKGRLLANPKIMITNGEQSVIDLSSDYVKTVTSEVMDGSSTLMNAVQKTYEIGSDEGIKITLLPFISPEGYVTLNIQPNYSTIKEQVYSDNYINGQKVTDLAATLLQRRNLDLKNVRIKDGETLVIGGMIRENETKTVKKIPVLGDLPGVGMFFRNSTSTKEKQELVIMITPKIIKDSEDVVTKQNVTL